YEEDGRMAMIPWDYNIAFGTFQGSNASSEVNSPIDTPVSGDMSDRPMIAWIFGNEEYTALYHKVLAELVNQTDFAALIEETAALIAPYVEKDPTKFCTYAEFEAGVAAIRDFCLLRAESVRGQLDGSIPSTTDGQRADSPALIDTSSLNLSDMGSMNHGGNFGGFAGGENREKPGFSAADTNDTEAPPENGENGNTPPSMEGNFPTEVGAAPSFDGNFPTEFGAPPSFDRDFPANSNEQPSESAFSAPSDTDRGDSNVNRSEPNQSAPTGEKTTEKFPSARNNAPSGSAASPLLLGISAIVLIVGILVAVKAKPHN
ncbi:MAG: CotH kinase family protein, partial [Ruminiclostridium sp.]|nr:CotH kinase family protein [Ruminiclostridium sp.]